MNITKPVKEIVAADQANVIGHGKHMPGWNVVDDFKLNFVPKTMGNAVIMGRITAETFKKPLKGRTNIVITRDPSKVHLPEGFIVVGSLEEALQKAEQAPGNTIWIIGGGQIYKMTLDIPKLVQEIHISYVKGYFPAQNHSEEITFPEIDMREFALDPIQCARYEKREATENDRGNSHDFTVEVWVRR